ncbi:hypothetical protein TWF718_010756, partial [Orbilia javanica]
MSSEKASGRVALASAPAGWHETKPGTWYRGLDASERILYFTEHINPTLTQWTITVCVKLPAGINYTSEADVKAAWISTRAESPAIACTIINEGRGMQYCIPTKEELIKWADETVFIDNSGRNGREMAASTTIPESSALYFFPEIREIAIHVRHELADGIGLLLLANIFLKNLRTGTNSTDTIGEEIALLPSSIFQSIDNEGPLPSGMVADVHHTIDRYSDEHAISLKSRLSEAQNINPVLPQGRVEYQFSEVESTTLLNSCRKKGITLTTALWAAQAQAALEHSGSTAGNLTCFIPINLRGRSQTAPNGKTRQNNTIILAYTSRPVSTNDNFVDWAKDSQQDLAGWRYGKHNLQSFQYL